MNSGQNDFKLVWFDFALFQIDYHKHETMKNQIKLACNHFDLKFISNYNIVSVTLEYFFEIAFPLSCGRRTPLWPSRLAASNSSEDLQYTALM